MFPPFDQNEIVLIDVLFRALLAEAWPKHASVVSKHSDDNTFMSFIILASDHIAAIELAGFTGLDDSVLRHFVDPVQKVRPLLLLTNSALFICRPLRNSCTTQSRAWTTSGS